MSESFAVAGDLPEQRPPARAGLALALDRRFGPYLLSKTLSLVGLWSHNVLCAVLAYQVTHSALFVGLVSVAQFGPQLVFVGWSGTAADRGDRVRQLVVGRLLCVAASGGLGLWCVAGIDRPGTEPMILGTSLVMGVGVVIGGPALLALVPELVRADELTAAVRLDSLPMLLGRTAGPAIGAFIIAGAGLGAGFLAAAATHLVFVALLGRLRIRARPEKSASDQSMRAALAHIRANRRLGLLLIGVTAASLGADPSITLAPAIAEASGGGQATIGVLSAGFGLGAAFGVVVMGLLDRWFRLPRLVTGSLLVLAAANMALALPVGTPVLVAVFVLAGAGMSVALTACTTLLQMATPDDLRGRVMSLWMAGFVGSRPIAAVMNGALADVFSIATALVVAGSLVALTAWACRASRLTVAHAADQ